MLDGLIGLKQSLMMDAPMRDRAITFISDRDRITSAHPVEFERLHTE
ncbi:hypothetical protein ACS0ZG_34770 [Burkholderia gladioli]|nr:hypothetical protein [Burkholderia gladioli]MDA0571437.1 hypothetical protein [Burkholderia gladioli]MDA0599425.1 hypothetical protein [Burkholderia gladioli]